MRNGFVILGAAVVAAAATSFLMNKDAVVTSRKESAFERVMRTGVLRCGYNTWPPAVMLDPTSGKLAGLIPTLVEEAAKGVNLKVEWVEQVGWGEFAQALAQGRFDAMCAGAWQIKEVASQVAFTRPIFYNPVYAYVRTDEKRYTDYGSLKRAGTRFATSDGDMGSLIAEDDFPNAIQVSRPALADPTTKLIDVAQGKADVVMMEPSTFADYNSKNPGKLKLLTPQPYRSFAASLLAVNIHEQALLQMFNTVLIEMELQGSIAKITRDQVSDPTLFVLPAKPYAAIKN